MAENETNTQGTSTQNGPELEERWIFGDGEGEEASEYVIHLGKPAFVAEIVTLEEGFDLEFVRWFDAQPTDEAEIDRLVNEAAEAIQRHDEVMERLMAEEDDEEE